LSRKESEGVLVVRSVHDLNVEFDSIDLSDFITKIFVSIPLLSI